MLNTLEDELRHIARAAPDLREALGPVPLGRIVSCDGGMIEVSGLAAPIGTLCRARVADGDHAPAAEVVGFRSGRSLMMLLGDTVRLQPGTLVRAEGRPGMVRVGEEFLGRAVDGAGTPIDGGPPVNGAALWPLGGMREGALERASVSQPFDCGIRAINALATLGEGQRVGIVAGSGVGKSVLLDMMVRGADCDIAVIGLIGERGREVSDFVARHMAKDTKGDRRMKTALVAVPADHAANLRLRGAQLACSLAEYFRAQGKRVLLVLDSLTRVAHAAREIALSLGEPGAARGYPPSALAAITKLIERAGNSARSGGAITGIYTVLADGDDANDPVVDTARAILDGHIVLSREIAQRGQYPAIDIPASLSRVMEAVATPAHRQQARALRGLVAALESNRDFLLMGAYRPGVDAQLDRALAMQDAIRAFLGQEAHEQVPLERAIAELTGLMGHGPA
ncbi:FliI/YscN family ATPase [Altererythrobacter lauratis]|uniref:Flagellum-specific ATP synthase n=1 Tax=Alteraurantiacibacter lauratis TaxID=2054627 RepID=A0ABV7EDK7_9SPHN